MGPGFGIPLVDEKTRARLGLAGIVVAEIAPGGSAEAAGLIGIDRRTGSLGDIIVKAEGKPVRTVSLIVIVIS